MCMYDAMPKFSMVTLKRLFLKKKKKMSVSDNEKDMLMKTSL